MECKRTPFRIGGSSARAKRASDAEGRPDAWQELLLVVAQAARDQTGEGYADQRERLGFGNGQYRVDCEGRRGKNGQQGDGEQGTHGRLLERVAGWVRTLPVGNGRAPASRVHKPESQDRRHKKRLSECNLPFV